MPASPVTNTTWHSAPTRILQPGVQSRNRVRPPWKGGKERQRDADERIDCRVAGRCPRAANKRVTSRTRQVECCRECAHSFDVRAPSLPAFECADAMH